MATIEQYQQAMDSMLSLINELPEPTRSIFHRLWQHAGVEGVQSFCIDILTAPIPHPFELTIDQLRAMAVEFNGFIDEDLAELEGI